MLSELLLHTIVLRFALAALCGLRAAVPLVVLCVVTLFMAYTQPSCGHYFSSPAVLAVCIVIAVLETIDRSIPGLHTIMHSTAPLITVAAACVIQFSAFDDSIGWPQVALALALAAFSAFIVHTAWTHTQLHQSKGLRDWQLSLLVLLASFVCVALPYLSAFSMGIVVVALVLRLPGMLQRTY